MRVKAKTQGNTRHDSVTHGHKKKTFRAQLFEAQNEAKFNAESELISVSKVL